MEFLAVADQESEVLPVAVLADLAVAASHLAVVVAEDEAAVGGSAVTIHRQFWGTARSTMSLAAETFMSSWRATRLKSLRQID